LPEQGYPALGQAIREEVRQAPKGYGNQNQVRCADELRRDDETAPGEQDNQQLLYPERQQCAYGQAAERVKIGVPIFTRSALSR
jgi:hypothetical protein